MTYFYSKAALSLQVISFSQNFWEAFFFLIILTSIVFFLFLSHVCDSLGIKIQSEIFNCVDMLSIDTNIYIFCSFCLINYWFVTTMINKVGQWFSKCDPQMEEVTVRKKILGPQLRRSRGGAQIFVSANLPDDSNDCSSLRTTGKDNIRLHLLLLLLVLRKMWGGLLTPLKLVVNYFQMMIGTYQ